MSKFTEKVIQVVRLVPYGTVVSYGQVAIMVGIPRAAIQVGAVLNGLEETVPVPWWRVINNSGKITIKGSLYTPLDQKKKLEEEGIKVTNTFELDIEKYRFRPSIDILESLKLDEEIIENIVNKYLI